MKECSLNRCRVFCFVLHFGFQGLKAIVYCGQSKVVLQVVTLQCPFSYGLVVFPFHILLYFLYGNSYLSFVSARLDYGIFMRWYIIMSPVYLILV